MIVRVELITRAHEPVAIVTIPRLPEPPSIVTWCGRAFHRFASAGTSSRELCEGDVYRECSAVEGVADDDDREEVDASRSHQ
jgi:hypothetical protein